MGSEGFRAKMEHYLYSGEKKHVMAGMAIIGVIFGVPWYLMNRGESCTRSAGFVRFLWKREARRSCALRTTSIKPNLGDGNDIPGKLVHQRDQDGDGNDKPGRLMHQRDRKSKVVA
ncbi:hypothetical protein R6Q59_009770 [Mikania micrantha]